MNLMQHLHALTALWTQATGRSSARLATRVAKDGKFFDRLASGGTPTIAVYERFIAFFRDPENWPGAVIPEDAAALLSNIPFHGVTDTSADAVASPDKGGDRIDQVAA